MNWFIFCWALHFQHHCRWRSGQMNLCCPLYLSNKCSKFQADKLFLFVWESKGSLLLNLLHSWLEKAYLGIPKGKIIVLQSTVLCLHTLMASFHWSQIYNLNLYSFSRKIKVKNTNFTLKNLTEYLYTSLKLQTTVKKNRREGFSLFITKDWFAFYLNLI